MSLLLGGVQSTLSTTCVSLLEEEGMKLQGPNIKPFTLEKENLILGLWQLQQAGQDFRIKEADLRVSSKMVLTFVTNHLPISTGDKLVKVPLQTFQSVASK
ncbi:TPA: hypothetical protein ACH3X3_010635 [Trebouxia sp. C0006]